MSPLGFKEIPSNSTPTCRHRTLATKDIARMEASKEKYHYLTGFGNSFASEVRVLFFYRFDSISFRFDFDKEKTLIVYLSRSCRLCRIPCPRTRTRRSSVLEGSMRSSCRDRPSQSH